MRKTYIFWWIVSAIFFYFMINELIYLGWSGLFRLIPVSIFFFIGYRRYRAYEQWKEYRDVSMEFMQSEIKKNEQNK